jgi:hypothetical protein
MTPRARIAIALGVAALGIAAVTLGRAPRMGASKPAFAVPDGSVGVGLWVDVSDPTQVGALPAMIRQIDTATAATDPPNVYGGVPDPSLITTVPGSGVAPGARADALFVGIPHHHTYPVPHPTQPGRWAVPFDAVAIAQWTALNGASVAVAAQAVGDAGLPTVLAALPAPVATLDPTWYPDAPVLAPWYCDGGMACVAPAPPDLFPSVTPIVQPDGGLVLIAPDAGIDGSGGDSGGGNVGLDAGHVGLGDAGVQAAPKL